MNNDNNSIKSSDNNVNATESMMNILHLDNVFRNSVRDLKVLLRRIQAGKIIFLMGRKEFSQTHTCSHTHVRIIHKYTHAHSNTHAHTKELDFFCPLSLFLRPTRGRRSRVSIARAWAQRNTCQAIIGEREEPGTLGGVG